MFVYPISDEPLSPIRTKLLLNLVYRDAGADVYEKYIDAKGTTARLDCWTG